MLINLLNNTEYKKIKVVCGEKEYFIAQKETVQVDTAESSKLKVFTGEKNRTMFNWFFLLIDHFVDENNIVNTVYYDAEFDVAADGTEGVKSVSIDTLEVRNDNDFMFYYSTYLNSENIKVSKVEYLPTDTRKLQKKSRFYLVFIASLLWVVIPFVLGTIYYETWWTFFVIAFLLIFFTVPSLKKVGRLKRYFAEGYIIDLLREKEAEYRANNGKPVLPEPNGFIEKTLHRILDKIFKKS